MKHPIQTRPNPVAAFTLVELLVVISIIALLAGLIVGTAGVAVRKARIARVQTERDQLVTAIESYKAKEGFYPPDNTNSTTYNPLFYELTGALQLPNGSFVSVAQENLTPANVTTIFNLGGFMNSSPLTNQAYNVYTPRAQQVASFNNVTNYAAGGSTTTPVTFTLLVVPLPGPFQLASISGPPVNPWHYSSSNPVHNPGEFDLWMDVSIAGNTSRISNWSKDPEVVTNFIF